MILYGKWRPVGAVALRWGSHEQTLVYRPFLSALMHGEIQRPLDAPELKNDDMIKLGDKQNRIYRLSEDDSIHDDSSFCSQILLTVDLQCNVFLLESFY